MPTMTSGRYLVLGGVAQFGIAGVSELVSNPPLWAVGGNIVMGLGLIGAAMVPAMVHMLMNERGASTSRRPDSSLRNARLVELRKTMATIKERNDRIKERNDRSGDIQAKKIKAIYRELEERNRQLADVVETTLEQTEKGPSLGVKTDGSGGYVGLFAVDYFEPYAVCPACGLEALHWMRIPAPDEGHDDHTRMLKYWSSQNAQGHKMRDYECIRTCRACAVNWGQNALGTFPPLMLGPFRPTKEDIRYANDWAMAKMADELTMLRCAQIPGHMIGVPVDDNLPQLIATGNVCSIDGEVIPALMARPKDTDEDRRVYREHDGKLVVVVNGFVLARKAPNGTWSVPTNPTRWAGAPQKPPGTAVIASGGEEAAELRAHVRNREEWGQQFWDAKDATQYDIPATETPAAAAVRENHERQALPAEREQDPLDVEIVDELAEARKRQEKVRARKPHSPPSAHYLEHGPTPHPGDT